MTEDKETLFIRKTLIEALKADVLCKDFNGEEGIVKEEKDYENPHDGISDLLRRVLDRKTLEKLDYTLGFNPEKAIRENPIPNKKERKKLKESEDDLFGNINLDTDTENKGNEEDKLNNNTEDKQEDNTLDTTDNSSEDNNKEDDDFNFLDDEEDSEEENEEDEDEEEGKVIAGKGAFDNIVDTVDKKEILKRAIKALNSTNIKTANEDFFKWFDTFSTDGKEEDKNNSEEDNNDEEENNSNEDMTSDLDFGNEENETPKENINQNTEEKKNNSFSNNDDDIDII